MNCLVCNVVQVVEPNTICPGCQDDVRAEIAELRSPKADKSGPAFPQPCQRDGHAANSPYGIAGGGMSLRDWFAGQALNGWAAGRNKVMINEGLEDSMSYHVAESCYRYADAMLAARNEEATR
jgi:hypothetical protein